MTEPMPPRAREKADYGTTALNLPPDGTLEHPLFLKRSGRGTTAGLCSYPCLTPPGPCCPNSPHAGPQQRSSPASPAYKTTSFHTVFPVTGLGMAAISPGPRCGAVWSLRRPPNWFCLLPCQGPPSHSPSMAGGRISSRLVTFLPENRNAERG